MSRRTAAALLVWGLLLSPGCGYTLKTVPPYGLQTLFVETFRNDTFEPGLEIDLTNGVIERFLYDGTLRVVPKQEADAVLKGKITKFQREVLRSTSADEVLEYRLILTTEFSLWDNRTQKTLWEEKNFVADTGFFVSGSSEKSEEKATQKAITELARRIVDRVVEEWPE
ncbi:MAG: LptE family protein [Candidatus Omnitrophota bacterium]